MKNDNNLNENMTTVYVEDFNYFLHSLRFKLNLVED